MIALIALLVFVLQAVYHCPCGAKTVVLMPIPTRSYIIFHSNIAKALIDLGHNVSLCVPAYLIDAGLVPHKDINIIRYGDNLGNIENSFYERSRFVGEFWEGGKTNLQTLLRAITFYKEIIEKILLDATFITKLQDLRPDFFGLDSVHYILNLMVLPYKLDVPFGLIGTYADYHMTRIPFSPSGEPNFFEVASDRKSFFQRVLCTLMSVYFYSNDLFTDNDLVRRFAPERPYKTINEIFLMAEIYIIEQDHILDYPRTALPNTKFVGGSSVRDARPLSADIKTFVDKSSRGIVVVSFGGCEFEVPRHIKSKMLDAFKNLDQNVVWKTNWTVDEPGNILASKWIPQNDLLGHEKTKVFISHCGKNGQYEALYHSVPILCLPIYGDQFYNSIRVSTKELGLYADIREISSVDLTALVKQLIENPKYKTNIQKASKLFKELYKVPSKEAAYWFDHVMKYGGEYMRSSYQKMPLYEFFLMDVIAFLVVVIVLVLLIFYFTIRLSCKFLCKFRKPKLKTT